MSCSASASEARADLIVLSSQLGDVDFAFAIARRAMRIVRQNLAWAFGYNVLIIPLAAFGYVSPAVAAAGMAYYAAADRLRDRGLLRRPVNGVVEIIDPMPEKRPRTTLNMPTTSLTRSGGAAIAIIVGATEKSMVVPKEIMQSTATTVQ